MDGQNTPPIPPHIIEMSKIGFWLLETLKNQGLSFLLLGLAVWHLQSQNNELSKEIRDCQEDKYQVLVDVLRDNTEALHNLSTNYGQEKEKTKKSR